MKTTLSLLINVIALTFTLHANATNPPVSKDVTIALTDVFVPGGFDSSSDTYIVASGIFPNGCYKWKGVSRKDVSAFEHELTSVASVSQGMCIQVLIPFTKEVRLGKLNAGTHTLRFLSGDGTFIEKSLAIE